MRSLNILFVVDDVDFAKSLSDIIEVPVSQGNKEDSLPTALLSIHRQY